MPKIKSREKAFATQNYDPAQVTITGVPDHIVEAVKSFINICVVTDAMNPGYNADFANEVQPKYENYYHYVKGVPMFTALESENFSPVGPCFNSKSQLAAYSVQSFCETDFEKLMAYKRP